MRRLVQACVLTAARTGPEALQGVYQNGQH